MKPGATSRGFGIILLMLVLTGSQALACPGCEYERMYNWWPTVAGLRLLLPVLLAANRLDGVRVFSVFFVYEWFWFYAYRYAIWYSAGDGLVMWWAGANRMALESGVTGAALLFGLGRLRWFQRKPGVGLPWWQAAIYVPLALAIRHIV